MTMLPNDPGMDVMVASYRAMRAVPADVRLDDGAVCPLDDTVLVAVVRGWCCLICLARWDLHGRNGMWLAGDRSLVAALVAEDNLQAAGLLAADNRRTCHTCRKWLNDEHTSTAHWAALDVNEMALDAQFVAAAERLRRLDRRCALMVGMFAVAAFGAAAGTATSPLVERVPDIVWWTVFGGLVAAAAATAGLVELVRWWRGWWPYRHNRELGGDIPAGGGVRDGR